MTLPKKCWGKIPPTEATLDDTYVMYELGMRKYFRQPRVALNKKKKWRAKIWITKSVFRLLYNGACHDFPKQQSWIDLWEDLRTKKYHEAVDKAIAEAISKPFAACPKKRER